MNLHDRLDRLGGPIDPVSPRDIDADLDRGRRAVRRRRRIQAVAACGLGVAAITAVLGLTVGGPAADTGPGGTLGVTQGAPQRLVLVTYRGPQVPDYALDKVPDGYVVQANDSGGILIAPATDPKPDALQCTGKICVYLEPKSFHDGASGEKLTVAGHPATLHTLEDGHGRQLIIDVSRRVCAIIQVQVPLNRAQIIELGAGLHLSRGIIARYEQDARGPGGK